MSHTQAVYFPDDYWTPREARAWLHEHDLRPIKKMRRYGSQLRYRIIDPEEFVHFSTKIVHHGDRPIYLVIGYTA